MNHGILGVVEVKKTVIHAIIFLLVITNVCASDLEAEVQLSDNVVDQGDSVALTVSVTNNGVTTATDVSAEISFVPSSGLSTSVNEKAITQSGQSSGTITAGNTGSSTFNIDTDLAGEYDISVYISGTLGASTVEDDISTILTVDSSMPVTADVIKSASSVVVGGTLTISGKVNNHKNEQITDVEVTLTASGFSFSPSKKSLGSIAPGSSKTATWSVSAPSSCGTKSISIDVTSSDGNPSDSDTISVTGCIEEEPISPPSGDSGGSSGPSGGASSKAIDSWLNVSEGEIVEMIINKTDIAIERISFEMIRDAELITLIVESFNELSENMTSVEDFYQYTLVRPLNFNHEYIDDLRIEFSVAKEWLTEKALIADDVVFYIFNNGEWEELSVNKMSDDKDNYYYYADAPKFGYFAISGQRPLLVTSLNPTREELKDVGKQALNDPLIITKLQEYFEYAIDVEKSKTETDRILNYIKLNKGVKQINDNETQVEIFIKNTGENTLSDVILIEAIPKAIIENINEIKDTLPRKYDIIIKEDPIIQWRFKQVDTSVVAWIIDSIEPGVELELSYKIDSLFSAQDHISSIVIKALEKKETPTGEVISHEQEFEESEPESNPMIYFFLAITLIVFVLVIGYVVKFGPKKPVHEEQRDPKVKKNLSEAVHKASDKGQSKKEIKKKLIEKGWDEEIVDEVLKE